MASARMRARRPGTLPHIGVGPSTWSCASSMGLFAVRGGYTYFNPAQPPPFGGPLPLADPGVPHVRLPPSRARQGRAQAPVEKEFFIWAVSTI